MEPDFKLVYCANHPVTATVVMRASYKGVAIRPYQHASFVFPL